jgi:outer membrane biosynthesis protein TonB
MINRILVILLLVASASWTQTGTESCCSCSTGRSNDAICLSAKEMRAHVDHIEQLRPSGLGQNINLAGTVIVEIRFGPDGKVACARAKSGHPIAIAAAMKAVPKWTFKPPVFKGSARPGCGQITIKYHLRDLDSSTEIQ